MGKEQAKKLYKHFVPAVKLVPDWEKNFNFVLITSMQMLEDAFCNWVAGKSFIAVDTETTGLDPEICEMVGYSFCMDGKTAYYVPVKHFNYEHNLGTESVDYIYQKMVEAARVFFFNFKFDGRIFEYYGYTEKKEELKEKRFLYVKYDMSKVPWYDVAIPCWLADTNKKLPSLKWSSEHFIGLKQMHFDEATADVDNFYFLNPETSNAAFYAGADALCTYLLVPATMKFFKESGLAAKIDNKAIYPLMHYETEKLYLNKEKLQQMKLDADARVDQLEREIYEALGYQINLNSPVQVSQAFERLGIDTGQRTKTGFMKTGADDLEKLPQEVREQNPVLARFVEYKLLFKLRSSYISVLLKEAENKGYLRAAYQMMNVPTGRLSAGKDSKNSFFAPINIQAIPKPHVMYLDVFDLHDRTIFSRKENIILGYQFVPSQYDENKKHIEPVSSETKTYLGMAEGMQPRGNVRDCIIAKMNEDSNEDEWVWAACDYCISPDSFVELEDGSKVKLSTLEGMEGTKIKTPYGFLPTKNFHYTGKRQKCVITLKSGREVICSPDHKFWVRTKSGEDMWKALKDIQMTDFVYEDDLSNEY